MKHKSADIVALGGGMASLSLVAALLHRAAQNLPGVAQNEAWHAL